MNILVAPISGDLFPAQLAAIVKLSTNNYKPRLCFVGSGGSVSTYIAKAAYWNPQKIYSICSCMNTSMFVSEWTSSTINILPRNISLISNGSMYKSTNKAKTLLESYLSPFTCKESEVWVAAINERTGDVLLSCNRNKEESIIKGDNLNVQIHPYEALSYLDGDLSKITTSILASSCIPIYISPVEIDGENYVDCGVEYGSSLTPMYSEVLEISKNIGVHIVYVVGCDLSQAPNFGENKAQVFDHLKKVTSHATRSFVRQDRNNAYLIIKNDCEGEPWYKEFDGCDLDEVISNSENTKNSLIEIYPSKKVSFNLFDFQGDDLTKCITEYTNTLKIRAWWSGDKNAL